MFCLFFNGVLYQKCFCEMSNVFFLLSKVNSMANHSYIQWNKKLSELPFRKPLFAFLRKCECIEKLHLHRIHSMFQCYTDEFASLSIWIIVPIHCDDFLRALCIALLHCFVPFICPWLYLSIVSCLSYAASCLFIDVIGLQTPGFWSPKYPRMSIALWFHASEQTTSPVKIVGRLEKKTSVQRLCFAGESCECSQKSTFCTRGSMTKNEPKLRARTFMEPSQFFSPCTSAKAVWLVLAPLRHRWDWKVHEYMKGNTSRMWTPSKENIASQWLDFHFEVISSNIWKQAHINHQKHRGPRPCSPSGIPSFSQFSLLGPVSFQGFFDHLQGLWVFHTGSARIVEEKSRKPFLCKHDFTRMKTHHQSGGVHQKQHRTISWT